MSMISSGDSGMSCITQFNHLRPVAAVSFAFLALLVFLPGCSTDPTLRYMNSIENNEPLDTATLYGKEIEDKSRNLELYLMEKGKIAQLYGDFDVSRESFDSQIEILKQRELHDDTTQGAEINVGSVLVNDNMLPYKSRLFEVEMIRLYQAINYMSKGNLEGALIEIRNAEFLMNEAEKARENSNFDDSDFKKFENGVSRKAFADGNLGLTAVKSEEKKENPAPCEQGPASPVNTGIGTESKKDEPPASGGQVSEIAEQSPDGNQVNDGATVKKEDTLNSTPSPAPGKTPEEVKKEAVAEKAEGEYGRYFDDMQIALEKSKSSFLNPYVVYMGGLLHEMSGELNDAYISYKKGLMLMPSNPYLQSDTIRLALLLNQDQDFQWLKTSFPQAWSRGESYQPNPAHGRLVVIYEDGWAPRKEQVFISMLAVAIAYPVYRFTWAEPSPLSVSTGGPDSLETYPICYMNALALRALKEEAKWRTIRQSARVVVKGGTFAAGAVMAGASNNGAVQAAGVGIMVASAIYNNMSEKADLRSWMTLPEDVQILVADMPEGKTDLKLTCPGMQTPLEKQISVVKGQTSVLRVVRVGERVIVQDLWPAPAPKAEEPGVDSSTLP